jgi:hypothetical protein
MDWSKKNEAEGEITLNRVVDVSDLGRRRRMVSLYLIA